MTVTQRQFTAALLDGAQPIPLGLTGPDDAPAGRRFDVYRNNIAVSLTEALEAGFPVLAKLLGAEFFAAMSGVYLRNHPPTSPLMMHYGATLPAFLEQFQPVRHLAYLPDVARLELAIRQAYHAADATAVQPAALQAMPTETLTAARISLAPALRIVRSDWPVHAIWLANTRTGAPSPQMQAQDVLITRPQYDPVLSLLSPGGAEFITTLSGANTFGAAVAAATKAAPNFDLSATLGALISGAAIVGITHGDTQ